MAAEEECEVHFKSFFITREESAAAAAAESDLQKISNSDFTLLWQGRLKKEDLVAKGERGEGNRFIKTKVSLKFIVITF